MDDGTYRAQLSEHEEWPRTTMTQSNIVVLFSLLHSDHYFQKSQMDKSRVIPKTTMTHIGRPLRVVPLTGRWRLATSGKSGPRVGHVESAR